MQSLCHTAQVREVAVEVTVVKERREVLTPTPKIGSPCPFCQISGGKFAGRLRRRQD